MDSSKKLIAVGSYESVLPFKALGLDVFVVTEANVDDLGAKISQLSKENYAALFLTEDLCKRFADVVQEVNSTEAISIVPIPVQGMPTNFGLRGIRSIVERAVGMDIFKQEDD